MHNVEYSRFSIHMVITISIIYNCDYCSYGYYTVLNSKITQLLFYLEPNVLMDT